jgi:hypothetical protein
MLCQAVYIGLNKIYLGAFILIESNYKSIY